MASRDLAELDKGAWRIRLYPGFKSLTELKFKRSTKRLTGRGKQTTFEDNKERDRALAKRVEELVAEGWVDTGVGFVKPQRKPAGTATLEDAFTALAETTIAALSTATSDVEDDAIWKRAIAAYGKLKKRAGGDATENLVHFFAVDGIALERAHPVVCLRAKAPKRRKARWAGLLEAASAA
jgi:hypothetical protein